MEASWDPDGAMVRHVRLRRYFTMHMISVTDFLFLLPFLVSVAFMLWVLWNLNRELKR